MNTEALAALPTAWRKSSYSTATGNCVEVAPTTDSVLVRHSKHPTAGTIIFSLPAWVSFIREVQVGSAGVNGSVTATRIGTDTLVRSAHTNIELRFDQDEWAAFIAGAAAGEFNFTRHLTAAN
jgi:Domain of unknown function (DUF397)